MRRIPAALTHTTIFRVNVAVVSTPLRRQFVFLMRAMRASNNSVGSDWIDAVKKSTG
jgi:hypothetical protein